MLVSGESVSVRVRKRGHLRGSSEKGKNLLRKKIICLFLSFLHSQLKHKKISGEGVGGQFNQNLRNLCCSRVFTFCTFLPFCRLRPFTVLTDYRKPLSLVP